MGFTSAVTDSDNAVSPDVSGLTYEQARDELVHVVSRLEAGGEPLEDSLALWERGEALAARCQQWLDGARARLDAARARDDAPDDPGDAPGVATDRTSGGDR
ncbi:exodeoxyribonuclease VII small subunit [Cellulosimicrobium sp. Marseille-Q8652]